MIETLLKEHIAALNENTAALKALASGAAASPASAKADKPAAEKPKVREDAPAEKPKASEKPAADKKPAPEKKAAKAKDPTEADILKVFGEFLDVKTEEEEATRKDFVMSILNELGTDRVRNIKPEDRQRAMDFVAKKLAGEEVNFGADDGEQDDLL